MNPCQQDKTIDMIREDLKEIKSDVKQLLEFKWYSVGKMTIFNGIFIIIVSVLTRALIK